MITVEVCATSATDCRIAQRCGASRIELCQALELGGLTPSLGILETALDGLNIPINVLIRPRPGDFFYNKVEISTMEKDIRLSAKAGASGVVLGVLTSQGKVDCHLLKDFCQLAASLNLSLTFHRAIDICANPLQAVEDIACCGAQRILSSGCVPSAEEGIPVLKEMVKVAAGRIAIMAGAGVSQRNAAKIVSQTGVNEIHLSASEKVASEMQVKAENLSFTPASLGGDYLISRTSEQKLSEVIAAVSCF